MSEDMRKMIDKVKNFGKLLNENTNLDGMKLVKTEKYSQKGDSTMGNSGIPYVAGIKNTYEKGKFTIREFIPRKDVNHDKSIMYSVHGFDDDSFMRFDNTLNWSEVEKKDKDIHDQELKEINSVDLTKAIKFMEKNKRGFIHIMNNFQKNEKMSKPLAFLNTIKDFYKGYMSAIFTVEVIAKIMIKYGYDFISLKEIRKLIN
jgi:hypothetical protein